MAFNYGTQELEINGIILTLNNCNFNPDGTTLFGYRRFLVEDSLPQYEYNIFGNASVKQSYNDNGKYRFQWSLYLESAELATLVIIGKEQNKDFSNSTGGAIILRDSRLALAERTGSFTRPVWSTSGIPEPTTALPASFEWYYPVFNIGIDGSILSNAEALLNRQPSDENWLYTLELEANEL